MKKVLFTLGVLLTMGFGATAQVVADDVVDIETNDVKLEVITPAEQVKESKKEIKEREKKMREMNDEVAHAKATNSLRRGYFVLVADNIQIGNTGYRRYDINSNSNFVLVQDEDGILQYAISQRTPGPNGLGGYTGREKCATRKSLMLTMVKSICSMTSLVPLFTLRSTSRCILRATVPWQISWVAVESRCTARSCLIATRTTDDESWFRKI